MFSCCLTFFSLAICTCSVLQKVANGRNAYRCHKDLTNVDTRDRYMFACLSYKCASTVFCCSKKHLPPTENIYLLFCKCYICVFKLMPWHVAAGLQACCAGVHLNAMCFLVWPQGAVLGTILQTERDRLIFCQHCIHNRRR